MAELTKLGYAQAFAGIALPNAASVALHEAVGFKHIGVYEKVGFKLCMARRRLVAKDAEFLRE